MPLLCRLNPGSSSSPSLERVKCEQSGGGDSECSGVEGSEGRWGEGENVKFVVFVNYYQDIFVSRHKRKVCKIFKSFAEFLAPRTPAQCRSHYQKMIIKYKTIAKLKKHYKLLLGEELYRQEFDHFRTAWELTHPPQPPNAPPLRQFRDCAVQTDPSPTPQSSCPHCPPAEPAPMAPPALPLAAVNPILIWNDGSSFPGVNFYYWMALPSEETLQGSDC